MERTPTGMKTGRRAPGVGASLFPASGNGRTLLLTLLFLAALGLRLYHITDPPLQFHATRQYISALIARAMYVESAGDIPAAVRAVALAARPAPGEPPVMEFVASRLYLLLGGEDLAVPRVLAVCLWLAAGLFLHLLAARILPPDGAAVATAFFLFLPFGVAASRSFMPDPLMIALFAGALLALVRWRLSPTRAGFALAAAAAAAAVFVKPVALLPLWGAFIGTGVARDGFRRTAASPSAYAYAAASLAPAILYFGYGLAVSPAMREFTAGRFMPHLLMQGFFWMEVAAMVRQVAGVWAVAACLLGLMLLRERLATGLLAGLLAGYAAFVLAFALHTHTHDYYHLMLIPIAALGVGRTGAAVLGAAARGPRWRRAAGWGAAGLALLLAVNASRGSLPAWGHEQTVATYRDIGERTGHSTRTLFLARDYGLPLQYHGWIAGEYWPTAYDFRWAELSHTALDRGRDRLDRLVAGHSPEFFVVIDTDEFERQPDLRNALASYPLAGAGERFRIYDLQNARRSP